MFNIISVDYDPGYTTGSRVFFTEDGVDPPKQGIIKNRANESNYLSIIIFNNIKLN